MPNARELAARLPMPHVKPEEFEYLPDSGIYIATSKARDYAGRIIDTVGIFSPEGNFLPEHKMGVNGYQMIQMAQQMGLYLPSSGEWDNARQYFHDNPNQVFHGITGGEIEVGFISNSPEMTGTLLAFIIKNSRTNEFKFSDDVSDLLKGEGFDGRVALIEHPWVQERHDSFTDTLGRRYFFTRSPRTRIVDVTSMLGGRIPEMDGRHVQDYDSDLGIPTRFGAGAGPEYRGITFRSAGPHDPFDGPPMGTRMIIRGPVIYPTSQQMEGVSPERRYFIGAGYDVGDKLHIAARLASMDEPSAMMERVKSAVLSAATQEAAALAHRYGLEPESLFR